MLTLNDGRSELWQWDTGRTLTVDTDCSQVHFSNKVFGRSIDVDVVDGVAIVPDILLQTDKDLNVLAFVGTAENGYTKISKTFKVNRRNKPADYVFTPPEQTSLEEIKEKIEYLESIQDPDAIKNAVEDYLEQNPAEAPVQSVNGKTGKVKLTSEDLGAISQDDLQKAINKALAQAKESGEFKGDPGEPGQPGEPGKTPEKGKDYFTDADKQEIAEQAAELVEVPESGSGVTDEQIASAVEDYMAEHPVSGLNNTEKSLMLSLLRKAVYTENMSATIAQLESLWNGGEVPDIPDIPDEPDVPVVTKYTITNELVNVKSSNSTSSVNEGASYMATLTADEGYEISNVVVTMGGTDVTASVYANGVISIPAVTGNVEITASASMAETEAVLPDDGLLAFWDLRNATSTTDWTPTIGDTSAYKLQSANTWDAQTVDSYGALLDNGTYGGATVQKLGSSGTWAGMNYGTEFTIVTMCYGGFVAPEKYYGLDGFKAFYPNPKYVKTDGTEASGTRTQNNENKLGTDEYATIIVRVNENLLDIFYNGEVAQSADGSAYDGFAHWVNSGLTIRSIKGQASGKLTALAVYDKALTNEEIVEALAYLKTLEVTA